MILNPHIIHCLYNSYRQILVIVIKMHLSIVHWILTPLWKITARPYQSTGNLKIILSIVIRFIRSVFSKGDVSYVRIDQLVEEYAFNTQISVLLCGRVTI